MNKYVAVVFVLLQIHFGYALICEVCSPPDEKCEFATKKECFSDLPNVYQESLKRFKAACMTVTVEYKDGHKFLGKSCVVHLISTSSPCELANGTTADVGGQIIVNRDCKLCYTDHCNAAPEEDILHKGNNNMDKK